ncbi:hypothetical protein BH09ACT10_BH09ACT10_28850 [soil metagenome]
MNSLNVIEAGPEHAEQVVSVIHRSFGARRVLDPPTSALDETAESVATVLARSGGLLVERRGRPVGAMLFDESRPGSMGFTRVSVDPDVQNRGIASAMVGVSEDIAEERGMDGIWLHAREELPDMVEFWSHRKYIPVSQEGTLIEFGKTLWLARELPDVAATRAFSEHLAGLLEAGDVLVMTGGLGAGKTTFTQGLGDALGVRGPITSPTFVIARTHPSLVAGPPLVHVDAYRLGASIELDDIDLDATTEESVTVVEWGEGMAEQLSDNWLEIRLEQRHAMSTDPLGTKVEGSGDDTRVITVKPHGPRWVGVPLRSTLLV